MAQELWAPRAGRLHGGVDQALAASHAVEVVLLQPGRRRKWIIAYCSQPRSSRGQGNEKLMRLLHMKKCCDCSACRVLRHLGAQAAQEAVANKAAGAGATVEGRKAWQRLAAGHARHPPPLQSLRGPTAITSQRSSHFISMLLQADSAQHRDGGCLKCGTECLQCTRNDWEKALWQSRLSGTALKQAPDLLAKETGDLGGVDLGALCAGGCHQRHTVAPKGFCLAAWEACLPPHRQWLHHDAQAWWASCTLDAKAYIQCCTRHIHEVCVAC